jgi:drug/metabolite transporter (DMT)-like permease
MNSTKVLGMVLIVAGILALAYQGFSYTTKEKVLDVGPLHVSTEKDNTIPLPPIVGVVAVIGGIVLLVAGGRKA